jgi:hypothetical protein
LAAGLSFLAAAANRSRQAELARKRQGLSGAPKPGAAAGLAGAKPSGTPTAAAKHYPVIYRYQEGYTNAVRRPVRISDFV